MTVRSLRRGAIASSRVAGTPTTYTRHAATTDNGVYTSSTDWPTLYSASTGTLDSVSGTTLVIGQYFFTPNYGNYEYFVEFDTSTVAGTITSATLSLWVLGDFTTTDFTLEARAYDWGGTVDTTDFCSSSELAALPLLATKSTAGMATGAYIDFTSQAAFLTNINQSGMTRIVVASGRYRAQTQPTNGEYMTIASADTSGTSNDPKLVIESLV